MGLGRLCLWLSKCGLRINDISMTKVYTNHFESETLGPRLADLCFNEACNGFGYNIKVCNPGFMKLYHFFQVQRFSKLEKIVKIQNLGLRSCLVEKPYDYSDELPEDTVKQKLTNVLCKGPDSKRFKLSGP